MIRNRLKSGIRKLAIKAFNMEFDVQDRPSAGTSDAIVKGPPPENIDLSVIPTVVDGSGDTPGPNHKEDIGRTWLAAQISGGVSPFCIDIRPPQEVVAGMLPNSINFPGTSLLDHLESLPDKSQRITIYDQTDALGSGEIAAQLREEGWGMARRLRGGFAEWIEHNELTDTPQPLSIAHPSAPSNQYNIGDQVLLSVGDSTVRAYVYGESSNQLLLWSAERGNLGLHPTSSLK